MFILPFKYLGTKLQVRSWHKLHAILTNGEK